MRNTLLLLLHRPEKKLGDFHKAVTKWMNYNSDSRAQHDPTLNLWNSPGISEYLCKLVISSG
jgi:hypothetical protein